MRIWNSILLFLAVTAVLIHLQARTYILEPGPVIIDTFPEEAEALMTPGPEWNLTIADDSMPYYIRINVESNIVNIYEKTAEHTYVPIKAMITSTGTYTLHEGVFPLSDKYEWRELYGGSYGHYACRIYSGLLFHSCPCTAMDVDTLITETYNALGTAASLGCMRLRDEDARWIYEHCDSGTLVEFYDDPIPGPFGKPEIAPLSEGAVRDPSAM